MNTTPIDVDTWIQQAQAFLDEYVYPHEIAWLNTEFRDLEPMLEPLRAKVRELGLWAPWLQREYGGGGLSLVDYARCSEVLGRSPFGHYLFHCQAPDVGNMEILAEFGTPAQQERWLKPLAAGRIRSCFSMTEPEFAGSNPIHMATTAIRDGDHWLINGHKWFTTAADGAAFAIVMAITDPDNPNPYARASMIIVPTDTPGFELVRNVRIMGDTGSSFLSHAEIRYTNVRVPLDHLLGGEGMGFLIAQKRLGPGRIHHCMRWIGIAERALDLMCRRAVARDLGGGKPLATKQFVQGWIAESRAEIDAARMLVLDAARQIDAEGTSAARSRISVIKFFAAGVMERVLDRAIQTHGALGMTDDTPLAFWYRHERGARIYDGPDEVHKAVVAREILKTYGFDPKRGS